MVMMFETDHEKIDDVDGDDDDDDDGNYKFSGPQKSESVFFLVFLSQLGHPFSQISRLLVFQDQNESEYLAKTFKNCKQLFRLFRCRGLRRKHGFDNEVMHPPSIQLPSFWKVCYPAGH